jgi:hypothetical protein
MAVCRLGISILFRVLCSTFIVCSSFALAEQADKTANPRMNEHLSDWLLRQNISSNSYLYGTIWQVPASRYPQAQIKKKILGILSDTEDEPLAGKEDLYVFIKSLPVTGRVLLRSVDPRWLQAHPQDDPILQGDHQVFIPSRSTNIIVLDGRGNKCVISQHAGIEARSYLKACERIRFDHVDDIWVIQANGQIKQFGVATWNLQAQDELSPGSIIWAPERNQGFSQEFSALLAQFLATQSYSALIETEEDLSYTNKLLSQPKSISRDFEVSSNDWGSTGLMQTPTARMSNVGEARFNYTSAYPYNRYNTFFQPFESLEFGFRYTDIVNNLYGTDDLSGNQTYKDKSIDFKARLFKETTYTPQVALGMIDLTGTGLFSSEYIVANKRFGDFDWSMGLGWGYLGSSSNITNPFGLFGQQYKVRQNDIGQGGNFSTSAYLRGPTAMFGGVQYHTPFNKLILKLEYDGNNYQNEPFGNNLSKTSPFNVGAVYRYSDSVDFSAGIERGNTVMFGFTLHAPLSKVNVAKVSDPPTLKVFKTRPTTEPRWEGVSADIQEFSGWSVNQIGVAGKTLDVVIDNAYGTHFNDRLERVIGILHRYAPSYIEEFSLVFIEKGIPMTERVVNRQTWVKNAVEFQGIEDSFQEAKAIYEKEPNSLPNNDVLFTKDTYKSYTSRFGYSIGPSFQQSLGGPDAFVLFRAGISSQFQYKLFENTSITGALNLGLIDNYGKFQYTAPSGLPRVRTDIRQYMTTSILNMTNLQLTHIDKLADNQYFSLYGGYLESMFAGFGGEWLYRPWHSPVAFGIDINRVQQRSFEQNFSFNNADEQTNYRVTTGHATAYWDTGFNSILAKLSVGRYLAGDTGSTIDLSRFFDNGIQIGAYVTKTNVSALAFGEGSFDKGIYLNIPFDVMTTTRSSGAANLDYHPLIRDGGAKLNRSMTLYDATNLRDKRQTSFSPSASLSP